MTRKEAIEVVRKNLPHLGIGATEMTDALGTLIPELAESEDEMIRKLLVWQVHRNIEDETNDLAQSVYDGIKGHDPDIEESIEDWKKCLAYLEKQKEPENTSASTMAPSCWEVEQKEQKPVEPSDDELQRHQDELYDFKVFAAKQAKEHHISFVHDFEWNNFCAELLSYFNEKQKEKPKPADSIPSDCTSDVKCGDRWHKVSDSLPDNGRLVLANDCLGNTLLARYDGEGNWEVSVYDNEDYYCRNTITKWCEIPSEKQKEQGWNKKPCFTCQEYEKGHKQGYTVGYTAGYNKAMKEVEQKEQKPAEDKELLKNILFQKKGITYDDYKRKNNPTIVLYFDELIECLEEYDKARSNR